MRIDLDASRAARREASGEAPVIVWEGSELSLPVELPYEVAEALAGFSEASDATSAGIVTRVIGILLGEEQMRVFLAGQPSVKDMQGLMDGISQAYGFGGGLGESPASPEP